MFGDRGIDDTLRAEFFQQSLRDLVGALIFGDLLAHDEDVRIAAHFLRHGVAERFAHGHGDKLGAFRHFGLGHDLFRRRFGGCGLRRFALSAPRRYLRALLLARRFLGFRLWFGRSGFAVLERGGILAFAKDHGDRRIDRDIVGAFGHQDFPERAFVDRFHFHGGFVGLDFGNDIAGFDAVAFLLEPLGEIALLHRRRERGHQNLSRHGGSLEVHLGASLGIHARRVGRGLTIDVSIKFGGIGLGIMGGEF